MRVMFHEHDVIAPALKELRFATGLLETASEANGVWAEMRVAWRNGEPDPFLPPVGERACRVKGDHAALWLAKSIRILQTFYV